jgi:putative endonuclease
MWHVYILQCADGSYYTGVTNSIKKRIKEHLDGKGGRYTRSHKPRKLVYQEKCLDRSQALKREYQIKKLKKQQKQKIINKAFGK